VVALKLLGLPKAHDAQRRTNGSLARGKDRSCQQYLDVGPYATREQWHEGVEQVCVASW
jgi:hypothetical protein